MDSVWLMAHQSPAWFSFTTELAPDARYALIEQRHLLLPCDMTVIVHNER